MKVEKTIKGRVEQPTNFKRNCLDHEYRGFQRYIVMGQDTNIYSGYKSTAGWKQDNINYKEYPLPLPTQAIDLHYRDKELVNYWLKFPTAKRKGAPLWLPIKLYQDLPNKYHLRDSELLYNEEKDWYEVHLTIQQDVSMKESYDNVVAVDLGERVTATVCDSETRQPTFLGQNVRGIRRHHSWLRQRLQERGLQEQANEISRKESERVDRVLHEVANEVVRIADLHDAFIVVGDVNGIRSNHEGQYTQLNRVLGKWAYNKLKRYIEYKAHHEAIHVVTVSERNTSKTCSCCGSTDTTRNKAQFTCTSCGYECHADFNGAKNILLKIERNAGYIPTFGASACARKPTVSSG